MTKRLPHVRTFSLSLAAVAAAGVAVAATTTPASASSPTATGTSARSAAQGSVSGADRQAQANAKLIDYVNDQLFNDANLSVVTKYFSPGYIQHNPTLGNGPADLEQLVAGLHSQYPQFRTTAIRTAAEGDLVFLQDSNVLSPGSTPQDNFDIYRVDDGKIVEQWDTTEDVPAISANANTMF